ncbi:hypothetical protein ID854_19575 [Xenorhabdus sp. M]|uniref:Uncharacterized protein n=1 Tax=Xenorhabdus szentirmaii TaxID=290112 RepID=A0AAW3YX33_9GAMM|nr:hypothetical protein [Xenorhabdus sp. 38]MBD2802575.1 hypothetical protein [Xenorhabdus sp. M]
MSRVANWAYTVPCTFWKRLGDDEYGKPLGYGEPKVIMCDYQGGLVQQDYWGGCRAGGKIPSGQSLRRHLWVIGESSNPDPIVAGADEIKHIVRYADTFERLADDYALVTVV